MTRPHRLALGAALGFTAIALLMASAWTGPFDDAGLEAAGALRGPRWTALMLGISWFGNGAFLGPLAVLVGTGLWVKRGRREGQFYLGSVLGGYALYGLLKWAFARPRPNIIARLGEAGWYSFPSGHTMMSAVILGLAVMMLTRRTPARGAVFLLVVTIAFSRVYLGVHYPTDVIAALLAGVAWVLAAMGRFMAGSDPVRQAAATDRPPAAQTNDSDAGR